jgi:hypothetical protein
MKKKMVLLSALLIIVLIGLIISAYYIYFFMTKCSNQECFYNSLVSCRKTLYVNDNTDMIMQYRIEGKTGSKCQVNVDLLQVKRGSAELVSLEGKGMICYTDLGVIIDPEKNLKNCHGVLKEEIQNIIIQRMHSQIVENIGKISEETTKVI